MDDYISVFHLDLRISAKGCLRNLLQVALLRDVDSNMVSFHNVGLIILYGIPRSFDKLRFPRLPVPFLHILQCLDHQLVDFFLVIRLVLQGADILP